MRTRIWSRVPVVCLLTLLAAMWAGCGGCGGCGDSQEKADKSAAPQEPAVDNAPKVRDGIGREFRRDLNPQRIVSTAPSVTEILFALGVGDRVVGVTTNCDYPPEAATKAKVGDFTLNYEAIIALQPDLVVGAAGFTDAARDQMDAAGIPFYTVSRTSIIDILDSIHSLATMMNATEASFKIIEEFSTVGKEALARIPSSGRLTALWVQWTDPLSTVGPGNFHHDLLDAAGGDNIAHDLDAPYAQFSEEVVIQRKPDVVLVPDAQTAAWVKTRFPDIPAVANNRVHVFSSDESARPGPRLVIALDALSKLLYPAR
ncbi:MAG: helical backbone metal receptor [Candidatus Poribacteria bacterium]|nr:helical backbone metal receptor [Candidatus Poribacteria bacterium]